MRILVRLYKDGSRGDELFEFLKGLLFVSGPSPCFSFFGELVKGFGYMQKVLDELPVEIDKPNERLDLGDIPQSWPVADASHFDRIHLYKTFQKDEPEILYCGLPECALLGFEVEPMSVEDVQDPYHNGMVFLLCLATKNEDVVHVYDYNSFIDELSEDVIHHRLENCWAVSETKEHDKRFEQASVHPKGCLPLISILDSHIVVSPSDVQFGEVLHSGS